MEKILEILKKHIDYAINDYGKVVTEEEYYRIAAELSSLMRADLRKDDIKFNNFLREEFLLNTQNYPKEYHDLFLKKYQRAVERFDEYLASRPDSKVVEPINRERVIGVLKKYVYDKKMIHASHIEPIASELCPDAGESEPTMTPKPLPKGFFDSSCPYHHDCVECGNSFWNKTKNDIICESCKSSITIKPEPTMSQEPDKCADCANYDSDSICNKCDDSFCMFKARVNNDKAIIEKMKELIESLKLYSSYLTNDDDNIDKLEQELQALKAQ